MTKKILIAIPTANGIHPDTFKSIYDLEIPEGYETTFQHFYGYCIDQVRNLIASWVVDFDFDYLFAVDYDMSFAPNTLKSLLSDNKDIVSGLYIQRTPHNVVEAYHLSDNKTHYVNYRPEQLVENALIPIDACGYGCVLVKKHVFEKIGYPWYTYHHALKHENAMSEDIDFCIKARMYGCSIYLDTTVKCVHHGQTVFVSPPLGPFNPANQRVS